MKRYIFTLLILLLGFNFKALSQPTDVFPNTDTLDTQIQTLMYEADIPGLSVAIIKNGKARYAKSYGVSNTETNISVNSNSVFEAASLGKPLWIIRTMLTPPSVRIRSRIQPLLPKATSEIPADADPSDSSKR